MSHVATNWAFAQRGLRPAARVVLLYLADRHNPDHGCFPSQDQLAADCEISRSGLNNILDELVAQGLIRRVRRVNPETRKQMSTRYILGFEEEFAQEPCPENGHGLPEKPCPKNPESRVQNLDTNPVKEPVNTTTDFPAKPVSLADRCLSACGPGLSEHSRQVIRQTDHLLQHWLDGGADLDADILPVLQERTASPSGRVIRTWAYFSQAVMARQTRREAQAERLRQKAEKQPGFSRSPESETGVAPASGAGCRSAEARTDRVAWLAERVREKARLPLSSMVSNTERDEMLRRGLVDEAQLRAVQIY